MKKTLLLIFFQSLLILVGCKNEINIHLSGPLPEGGQVAGKIVLAANTKLDTVGLEVLTGAGSAIPVNLGYAIDTTGKTSTTLLMNKAGDVVLMGYNYPGQTESNLSAESTALALLMNTLTLRSLSEAGKLEVIGKIKADPNYKTLVNEISGSLVAGKAVTDTTNTKLIGAMAVLFKSSSNLRVAETSDNSEPIKITKMNTSLSLQNNRVAHTYVAGVYKDKKQVGTNYVIGGQTLFATSLTEAAEGVFGDGYGIPEPVMITLPGNGEYELRIRSGKPGEDDGSVESRMARNQNVHRFLLNILKEIVPFPDGCDIAVVQTIPAMITSLMEKNQVALNNASSHNVFGAIAFDITGEALEGAEELMENCGGDSETIKFLKGMGRTFSLIGLATKVMAGANITAHVYDLFHAVSAINTCYQVKGLKTYACGEDLNYLIQIVSGNTQKGEFGKPLASSLVVKVTDKAGKAADKADVTWTVNTGEGSLSAAKSITNAQGIAEVKWTLGVKAASQQVTASVNEDDKVKTAAFNATATPGVPTKVEIVSGNSQSAAAGKALSEPLIIKVTDQFGHPVPKVEVDWQIKSGGGSFMFSNKLTSDEGTASANWILGQSGTQTIDVVVKNKDGNYVAGAPLRFNASVSTSAILPLLLGTWVLTFENIYTSDYKSLTDSHDAEKEFVRSHWLMIPEYIFEKDEKFIKRHADGTNETRRYILDETKMTVTFEYDDGSTETSTIFFIDGKKLILRENGVEYNNELIFRKK